MQPRHAQVVSRSLKLERDNWACTRYRVLDGVNQIYTAKVNVRKPQLAIESDKPVGTVVLHSHTCRIDITIHGAPLVLVSHGMLMNKWTYTSPALQKVFTWKRTNGWSKMFDFVCLEGEIPVAQFTVNNWGWTKIGKIDFFGESANSGVAVDEVVTTGMALAHFLLVQMTVPGLALASSVASV